MEKTLKLSAEQAKAMLGNNDQLDALIKANFTHQELSLKITDRIKTFQDALDYTGQTMEQFNWRTERDTDHEKATKELEVIAEALREGKELAMAADWYYPYFKKPAGSGSGFSCNGYGYGYASSDVGARLCVDTSAKAIYMGKQFTSIYTRHLSPKSN